ncbi:DUF1906 domain-containing protein [Streptomyces thinghirensis]|nr:DUF1906 domain-containing protein [Streptomyces thinghirensis]
MEPVRGLLQLQPGHGRRVPGDRVAQFHGFKSGTVIYSAVDYDAIGGHRLRPPALPRGTARHQRELRLPRGRLRPAQRVASASRTPGTP